MVVCNYRHIIYTLTEVPFIKLGTQVAEIDNLSLSI